MGVARNGCCVLTTQGNHPKKGLNDSLMKVSYKGVQGCRAVLPLPAVTAGARPEAAGAGPKGPN
eukprot:1033758-Prorocentrum_minimum.AAC.1